MAGKEYLGAKKGRITRPEGKNGRKGISGRKERAEEEGLECRKAGKEYLVGKKGRKRKVWSAERLGWNRGRDVFTSGLGSTA
jgi:hypothetical protein